MAKILIVYCPAGGTIEKMAYLIRAGAREEGVETHTKTVDQTTLEDLKKTDAIILGSPCYLGTMSGEMKKFIDNTYQILGELDGKVGGAFTASGHIAGGNETAILSMLEALLIHGVIVQGNPESDPYGPVVINSLGDLETMVMDSEGECHHYGARIARLTKRLAGE